MYKIGEYKDDFFDTKIDYFDEISKTHKFNALTESNKEGVSYRKGIYITKVTKIDNTKEYKLLRCSTNLHGPTDNFKDVDYAIVNKANELREKIFPNSHEFNHVLAQIYNNEIVDGKEKKAKIKEHSDKTKDMPHNAVMAFCTFYTKLKKHEDRYYTILRFKLKKCVDNTSNFYPEKVDVILRPNSIFLINLETNRLYTHEIVVPKLNVKDLPTRLGYVIRCSNKEAVYNIDTKKTFIKENGELKEMLLPTEEDIVELRKLYYKENMFSDIIEYPPLYFSMNNGDFMEPDL